MDSEKISKIKNKLKKVLKKPEVWDIILFGSSIKGKSNPKDIDIAIITDKEIQEEISGFHISTLNPKELIINPVSLSTTLLKEGYSLRNNKPLAEALRFKSRALYTYKLSSLSQSDKVKIVRILHGNKEKGMVEQYKGEWLSNQVFIMPLEADHIFEKFFLNFKINYTKKHILIH